jgi:hypothetical protein
MQDPTVKPSDEPHLFSYSPALQRLLRCASSWHDKDRAQNDASVEIKQTTWQTLIHSGSESLRLHDFYFDLIGYLEFERANYKRLGLYGELDHTASRIQRISRSVEFVLQKQDLEIEFWPRVLEDIEKVHFLKIIQDTLKTLSGSPRVFAGRNSVSSRSQGAGKNAMSKSTQTQARCPDAFPEPSISGRLQGTDVSAFPDTGAATNYISLPYTQRHGLAINGNVQKSVRVGDGSLISVIGTTTLPFSFAGESTNHELTFHVLRNSVHDIILGSLFLRATQTFTRFGHRVGRKIRKSVSSHRVFLLGSEQYVNGLANGVRVDAVPDTGADVSVMSAAFAVANGFEVDCDEQHRILLEFADGSTARARGVVMDVAWEFGADDQKTPTDVYVLSSLPVDMVLGFGFLCQTEAFREHWHNFWNIDDPTEEDDAGTFCVIRVLKEAGEGTSCEYRYGVIAIWRLNNI